jgi:hypothetical protein
MGKEKPSKFSAAIPFAGFYESWHDDNIDRCEEQMFWDDNGDVLSQRLIEMFAENLNYEIVRQKYARQYVAVLSHAIGIPMHYEEMVSPREYNFMTDRLFAFIERSNLAKMLRAVRGKWLNQKITDCFTSRSGFISRYPNHIGDWPRIAEWDYNHVGTVLSAYCDLLREQKKLDSEMDMTYEEITYEDIEPWLCEAAEASYKGLSARALKINDYLRQRAERRPLALAS